jgi:steroid delta-isomerase-like uncharacterized protein
MTAVDETVGIESTRLRDWADRFLAAWNALDAKAVAALCTEDVMWTDPSTRERMVGREAVREFVHANAVAFPDLNIVETAPPCVIADSSKVLSPYRMTGTMLGPLAMFKPTGRKLSLDGVDEWTFRGELLCSYRTFYDTIEAARQLGIMPASGSHGERLMSRLQHVQARWQRRTAAAG